MQYQSYFQATNALPSFVAEDHTKFVQFLQGYYKWCEENETLLQTYSERDIDSTLTDEKWSDFAYNIPTDIKANKEWIIRFLKEFYDLKGTEESFDWFTRIIWNLPSALFYTKTQLLKASTSNYKKQMAVYVKSDLSLFELEGQVLEGSDFKLYIDEVYKTIDKWILVCDRIVGDLKNTPEITFLKQYQVKNVVGNDLEEGDVIVDLRCSFRIDSISYGILDGAVIKEKGTDYKVGDSIKMTTNYRGYGFYGKVVKVDDVGGVVSVKVMRKGFGIDRNDVELQIDSQNGKGCLLEPIIKGFGDVKSVSMLSSNVCYDTSDVVVDRGNIQYTFTPVDYNTLSYYQKQNGRYLNNMDYYSDYTYEVRVEGEVDEDLIRTMLHLCGLKMFVHKQNVIDL